MKELRSLEKPLLQVFTSVLIIVCVLFVYIQFYFMALVVFVGGIIIWLIQNKEVHLTVFWTLILTGAFSVIFLRDFLMGIVLIILAIVEDYLKCGISGDMEGPRLHEKIFSQRA